jgi:antitoxin (DNA-binding transcriptional repressor) of toxin-antitoxin stability system
VSPNDLPAVVLWQRVRHQLGSSCQEYADGTSKVGGRVQHRRAPLDVFVGRAAERARVAEVVARVEAGQPWLVAIEGDPGVGKTALVRRCLAEAAGLRVLQARASLPEADLDFGIVDQLLRPAGEAVLTAETSAPTSSFAVGARMLEVVGEQLATGALAIVIDDLQWSTGSRRRP